MDIEKIDKSLSTKQAKLIVTLYEQDMTTFTLSDASKILGLEGQSLSNFIYKMTKKGILTKLTNGLYNIVPYELGEEKTYLGDEYLVAKEIVKKKCKPNEPKYFISHGSAMFLHRMVTQPQLDVYTSVTKQIKQQPRILGTKFHFVTIKEKDYFGLKKFWIENSNYVWVSNIERTIIDGLKQPDYCGGFIEVAKAMWIKRDELNIKFLVDYALLVGIKAVIKRLGYLLDVYEIKIDSKQLKRLKAELKNSYSLLDPSLLNEGDYHSKWKLRLNVSKEELLSIIRT